MNKNKNQKNNEPSKFLFKTKIKPPEKVIFGAHDLVVSWVNGVMDVKYKNATKAAESFLEFFKQYIEERYYIISKNAAHDIKN